LGDATTLRKHGSKPVPVHETAKTGTSKARSNTSQIKADRQANCICSLCSDPSNRQVSVYEDVSPSRWNTHELDSRRNSAKRIGTSTIRSKYSPWEDLNGRAIRTEPNCQTRNGNSQRLSASSVGVKPCPFSALSGQTLTTLRAGLALKNRFLYLVKG